MTGYSFREQEPAANRLDTLRSEIDSLDRQILALVIGRTSLALQIADAKQDLDVPTMVSGRHAEVVNNYTAGLSEEGPLTAEDAVALCETIMQISRDAQDRRRFGQSAVHEAMPSPATEPLADSV